MTIKYSSAFLLAEWKPHATEGFSKVFWPGLNYWQYSTRTLMNNNNNNNKKGMTRNRFNHFIFAPFQSYNRKYQINLTILKIFPLVLFAGRKLIKSRPLCCIAAVLMKLHQLSWRFLENRKDFFFSHLFLCR